MSIFNEYLEENVVVTNYDPITGIEFQGIDTTSVTEMCIELRESFMYMNGKMYVIEVMEHFNMLPVNEGVIKSSKDFFKSIIDKLKVFLNKIIDFFKNIFAKMEVMFTTNGKSFLDKYSEGIKKSFSNPNAEWVEFNERYVLEKRDDEKDHQEIYKNIDRAINSTINVFRELKDDALKIAEEARKKKANKDSEGNADEDKVKQEVNKKTDPSISGMTSEEQDLRFKELEEDISNSIITGAKSFDDVKEKFKEKSDGTDKDTKKVLDSGMGMKFITYCSNHVSKDLMELKNTQTKMSTLIKNTQTHVNDINNRFGITDDNGNMGPIRKLCGWYISTLSFLQDLNAKRVSSRTQVFNYYISVLKRYTKKNYKIITGTEAPKKGKVSEYKNKIVDKAKGK